MEKERIYEIKPQIELITNRVIEVLSLKSHDVASHVAGIKSLTETLNVLTDIEIKLDDELNTYC